MDNSKLITLLKKHHKGTLTEAESDELSLLYETAGYDNGQLLDENDENVRRHIDERYIALRFAARKKKIFKLRRTITAAAAVIIICFAAGIFYGGQSNHVSRQNTIAQNDIAPGHNGAILTLANGSKVMLDSTGGHSIIQQGTAQVINNNGQLIYHAQTGTPSAQIAYNTLSTPRARQFQLVLPDGTKVWLNAESSIRYPVTFTGNERKVEISGEAYFEVVYNSKMPFRVIAGNETVEDLGTHFDINAYTDEQTIKTTLLEGSVKVTRFAEKEAKLLTRAGQQAQLTEHSFDVVHVNTEDVIAWKEGYFIFDNEPLENVMNKIARWYNVDIIFKDEKLKKENTYGYLSRFSNVSKVLNLLELTGAVKFNINGNTIIVDKK